MQRTCKNNRGFNTFSQCVLLDLQRLTQNKHQVSTRISSFQLFSGSYNLLNLSIWICYSISTSFTFSKTYKSYLNSTGTPKFGADPKFQRSWSLCRPFTNFPYALTSPLLASALHFRWWVERNTPLSMVLTTYASILSDI